MDAVIGRFVLMHQAEPAALLARARSWVRRGGVVAFLESDNAACRPGMHSRPHSPTYDAIVRVWQDVIRAAGAHVDMGARLEEAFVAAGMSAPVVRLDTYVSGDPASPNLPVAAESLRSMLPLAAAVGVAGAGRGRCRRDRSGAAGGGEGARRRAQCAARLRRMGARGLTRCGRRRPVAR